MLTNKTTVFRQMKVLAVFILSFCLSACISRLSRPEMMGQIIDDTGHPIAKVQVGETVTDLQGYFSLDEQRYYAFLLTEILAMEAPMVYVQEHVSKVGYQSCFLTYYNPYGGGQRKGAKWQIGQIVLHAQLDASDEHEITDCTEKNIEK